MKKATIKNKEQKEQNHVEYMVKKYTGLTEEQYRMTIFESGIAFLQHMEGKHEDEYFMQLSKHKGFWNWWTNKWYSRDHLFVNTVLFNHKHLRAGAMYKVYERWHSLPSITQKNDIESSYYRMLDLIAFDKQVQRK